MTDTGIRSTLRDAWRAEARSPIDATTAISAFFAGWIVAQLVSGAALGVLGESGGDETPIRVLSVVLPVAWGVYLATMWIVSKRSGTGAPFSDFGIRFRPIDSIGLGIGVVAQIVLVRVVYLPFQAVWPDTFSNEELQRNAQSLADRANTSAATVALCVLVVIGAPVVEELFYRGLLQRSLLTRFHNGLVVIGVAAVFALIHLRPIEYPGLFAFGLVLGVLAKLTGRLGMSIMTHIGFNAVGILLVL